MIEVAERIFEIQRILDKSLMAVSMATQRIYAIYYTSATRGRLSQIVCERQKVY